MSKLKKYFRIGVLVVLVVACEKDDLPKIDVDRFRGEITSILNRLSTLDSQLHSISDAYFEFIAKQQELKTLYGNLTNRIGNMRGRLNALNSRLALSKNNQEIEDDLDVLRNEISDVADEIPAFENAIVTAIKKAGNDAIRNGWWVSDDKVTYRVYANDGGKKIFDESQDLGNPEDREGYHYYFRIQDANLTERAILTTIKNQLSYPNVDTKMFPGTDKKILQIKKAGNPTHFRLAKSFDARTYTKESFITNVVGRGTLTGQITDLFFTDGRITNIKIEIEDYSNVVVTISRNLLLIYVQDSGIQRNIQINQDQIYKASYVGTDLNHPTQQSYTGKTGFFSDPIYSTIDKNDISTFIKAFVKDAERYGVDLSHVDVNDYRFIVYSSLLSGGLATPPLCMKTIDFGLSRDIWEEKNHYEDVSDLLFVVWHELGHAILELNHPCAQNQLMEGNPSFPVDDNLDSCTGYTPRQGNPFYYNHPDQRYNWQRAVRDMFLGKNQSTDDCAKNRTGQSFCPLY